MVLEKNLITAFLSRAYRFDERPVLASKVGGQWTWISWGKLAQQVEVLGRALLASGVTKGDRFAILAANSPDWIAMDLAIMATGAISVPLYPTATDDHLTNTLTHCEAVGIAITESLLTPTLHEKLIHLNHLQHIVVFGHPSKSGGGSKLLTLDQFKLRADHAQPKDFYQAVEAIECEDVCSLMYTSGTTDQAKGVMLTHHNIVSNCAMATQMISLSAKDISLSFLPLSHAFERTCGVYTMLYAGARIAFAEAPHLMAPHLLEIQPTLFCCVPRVLEKAHDLIMQRVGQFPRFLQRAWHGVIAGRIDRQTQPLSQSSRGRLQDVLDRVFDRLFFEMIRRRFGGRLRFMVSGGAPLRPQLAEFFQAVGVKVLQGYGLTETSPVVSVTPVDHPRLGSVGKPLSQVVVKLAADGEILVKGPLVMKGYFKDPSATSQAIDSEGFFHTGDVGQLDQDGFLYIIDRKKDLIITSGGKNISPQGIEAELTALPLIDQACLVGDGQKCLCALVVPSLPVLQHMAQDWGVACQSLGQAVAQPRVVEAFCDLFQEFNKKQAPYAAIKKFHLLSQPFSQADGELTISQKLCRKAILAHYGDVIDDMYRDL